MALNRQIFMGRCSKLRVALDTFYCVIRELVLYNCNPIRVEHKKMASEHTSSDFESSVAFGHQRIKAAAIGRYRQGCQACAAVRQQLGCRNIFRAQA